MDGDGVLRRCPSPTDDEFPVALDGRLLDTPAKVIAYIDEINANRSAAQHGG